jgi:carbohydrate-binding DOMON domain-containing protein
MLTTSRNVRRFRVGRNRQQWSSASADDVAVLAEVGVRVVDQGGGKRRLVTCQLDVSDLPDWQKNQREYSVGFFVAFSGRSAD